MMSKKEKKKKRTIFPAVGDIDKFVDDCFEFVADNQKDSDVRKIPRGTIRHANKVVNLKNLLEKAKSNIAQNVIATRAIENRILEVEAEQQITRDAVLGVGYGRGKSKNSVPLQCGKPLAFTEAHLTTIEIGAQVGKGVGSLVQKNLNSYDDDHVNDALKNLPTHGGKITISGPLFKRIVITCSGSYLSENDAALLYEKAERTIALFRQQGRISHNASQAEQSKLQWELLSGMLKKRMLVAYLARGVLLGESKLNLKLGFGDNTLDRTAGSSSNVLTGVIAPVTSGLGITSNGGTSTGTGTVSSTMLSVSLGARSRAGTADGLLNPVKHKRQMPHSQSSALENTYGLSRPTGSGVIGVTGRGGKAKMVATKPKSGTAANTARSTSAGVVITSADSGALVGSEILSASLGRTTGASVTGSGIGIGISMDRRAMSQLSTDSGVLVRPEHHSYNQPLLLSQSQSSTDLASLADQYMHSQRMNDKLHQGMSAQMAWVTQTISLNNGNFSAAKTFSKHMGARKMESVLAQKVVRTKTDAVKRWKSYSKFARGEEETVKFLKVMGSYRIINAVQSSKDHKMHRALHKFKECNAEFNSLEQYACVVEIQRVARGMLARTLSNRLRRRNAATTIARIVRGRMGRKRMRKIRYMKKRYDAARCIAKWWNNLKFQRLMRKIRANRRRERMAIRIQQLARAHRARQRMKAIRLIRQRKLSAIKIQSMFRRFKAIVFVEYYRHNRLMWDAALLISKRARIVLAKARVRLLRFHNGCAMIIQLGWLCHRARGAIYERKRVRAARLIQRVVRGNMGRARFKHVLLVKNMFNQQKLEAIAVICPLILGYRTRRIWGPRLKEFIYSRHRSSTTIQQLMDAFMRARIARQLVRNMRERRKVELARRKEATRVALLREKKARMIQCVMRGRWGRAVALKRQQLHRQQQALITMTVPAYYRKRNEYYHEQMIYHRPYVTCLQRAWRCYAARVKVEYTRRHVNSIRIQQRFRIYLGIRASKQLLKEMKIEHALRMEAAVPIQCMIRAYLAKCLCHKHRSGGIVAWYFREVRSAGLIGRALTNFRIRKRELNRQNAAMFIIHKYAKRWLTIRWFRANYAQLVRDRAKRAKERIRRDKQKLALAAIVIQCMVRKVQAKAIVNQQRLDVMMMEQEMAAAHEKSDFMGDLMRSLAQGPLSSK